VEQLLVEAGVTFKEWLVLATIGELVAIKNDAVNQSEIARRLLLDRRAVSNIVLALDRRGFLSRYPEYFGPAWRIFLEEKAERLLARYDSAIANLGRAASNDDQGKARWAGDDA